MSSEMFALQVPPVPAPITSLDGQTVDTGQVVWAVRSAIDGGNMFSLNWELLGQITIHEQCVFSPRAQQLMKLYIADCLVRRKATTAYVYFSSFLRFGRWLVEKPEWHAAVCGQTGFDWSNYDEDLARAVHDWGVQETASNGDYFRHLRIFYRWGVARQYPDFNLETMRLLDAIKAKMHSVGHHVRFRHPTKGPFSPAEKALIVQAVRTQKGQETDRVLVMLHLELGLNPKAAARLQNRDFRQIESSAGTFYHLDVPRIKKRVAERETKRRPVSPQLGQLLARLQQGEASDHLLSWLNARYPEGDINSSMKRWADEADLISPRSGERLHLNPRRFRYTLATHLAEEGVSRFHLAQVLDHTDLNYVAVYTETTSTIAIQVATATDAFLEPLVHRFLGKIVDTIDKPAFPDMPVNQLVPAAAPHLTLPVLNTGGIGVCGRDVTRDGLCRLFPPLSCYLCPSFAALRTGPHQELMASIQAFLAAGEAVMDPRIASQFGEVQQAIQELLARVATEEVTA
ncbi:MAG: tyrosine-type recombinase/integrase [Candidatus Promineifilaceae bacterium]